MQLPARYPITIYQGMGFNFDLIVKDASDASRIDLTDYKARMIGRETMDSDDMLFNWSTEGDAPELVIGDQTDPDLKGLIRLNVSAVATRALDFDIGVYDLEMYNTDPDPDEEWRLIYGSVKLDKEVTHYVAPE